MKNMDLLDVIVNYLIDNPQFDNLYVLSGSLCELNSKRLPNLGLLYEK
jgi:hypothetical protein